MVPQIIGIHKLAEMLDCTAASIYSHIARKNWSAIPAPIRMGKRLAWLQTAVDEWFACKLASAARAIQHESPVQLPKKLGRPTKAESRAKREQAIPFDQKNAG